jgi:hypothetical protein
MPYHAASYRCPVAHGAFSEANPIVTPRLRPGNTAEIARDLVPARRAERIQRKLVGAWVPLVGEAVEIVVSAGALVEDEEVIIGGSRGGGGGCCDTAHKQRGQQTTHEHASPSVFTIHRCVPTGIPLFNRVPVRASRCTCGIVSLSSRRDNSAPGSRSDAI